MNANEQLKLDIVSRIHSGRISLRQGIQLLDKSESTLFRYLRQYRAVGASFVEHKNCNRIPKNKINSELETKIILLCKEKYFDFNRSHAREELAKNENIIIPKDTFNRLCQRNELLKKHVRRKKKIARHRRDRMKQRGLMLQMDGSPHRWFGHKKTCLIICIDDATGDILHGEFSPTETTFACMNVTKEVLKKYGVFQILYTDRAGIFGKDPVNNFGAVKREGFSALKKCLSLFSIHVLYAYSAEAKGRVERAFKTLQDRLIPILRLNNINSILDANKYLNDVYLPIHRERFNVEPAIPESGFTPLINSLNLDDLFYVSLNRKIKNDHTFQKDGVLYDLCSEGINHSGKEVEIRSFPNGKVSYYIDDKEVSVKKAVTNAA